MNGLDLNENSGGGSGSPNSSSQQNQRAPHAQDNLNYDPDLPAPPQDNNQVAAWYDTDL